MKPSPFEAMISELGAAVSPLEVFFQEQSYSSLHLGWSLAWDHFRCDIANPCGVIANFCRVIANPCSVITNPWVLSPIPVALSRSLRNTSHSMRRYRHFMQRHRRGNIGAWCSDVGTRCSDIDARCSDISAQRAILALAWNFCRYWRQVSGDFGVGITPQMCNRVTNHGDRYFFKT